MRTNKWSVTIEEKSADNWTAFAIEDDGVLRQDMTVEETIAVRTQTCL